MKKLLSLFLSFVIITASAISASALQVATEYEGDDLYDPPEKIEETVALVDGTIEVKAKSCVLIEPNTLTVLYENNSNEQLAPASITKIMSLVLIMEAIDGGKLTLETQITASEHACSMGGSQIWLEPGETMTVDELLKATVIASANDATVALAEAVAGSEEAFVNMMNSKAQDLGMTNTHFINCTGLDADGHLTTAYDVALMSCELVKHELITKYSTVWMDTLRNGESSLVNTNKLVRFYTGWIGLKTGTTSTAGHCLSAAAKRDGMTLIAVVMCGENSAERFNGARKLLDFGFANYAFIEIAAQLPEDTYVSVSKGEKKAVSCETLRTLSCLTNKGSSDVQQSVELPDSVKAPVAKGDVLGGVRVTVDGEEIGVIEITASEGVKKMTLIRSFSRLVKGMFTF